MTSVAQLDSFVHDVLERARFRPALGSVVRTLLGGIVAAGSVVLSEVLRPQVQKENLHAAEPRVSQALKNATALDTLPDVYLDMVAEAARPLRFRTVDGSDVTKPAGRAFEHLDVVRDGSCKPRNRVVVGPHGVQPSTPPDPAASRCRRRRPRSRGRGVRRSTWRERQWPRAGDEGAGDVARAKVCCEDDVREVRGSLG